MRARAGSASRASSTAASSSSGSPLASGICFREAYERPSRARKIEADADADRRLDRLQPDPEREAARVGNAVLLQRQRDRGLHEADVAGPEREDRRDVHQHEHEAGGRERLVDVERAHRRPDRGELEEPAEVLVHRRRQRRRSARASRRARAAPARAARGTCRSSSSGSGCAASPRSPRASSSAKPITNAIAMLVTAQCGSFAVQQHPDDERAARGRGRTAGARRPCRSASPRCPGAPASAARARRRAPARRRGRAERRSRRGRRRTPRRRVR